MYYVVSLLCKYLLPRMFRYGIIFILSYASLACQASGEKSFPKTWSGFIENKGQIIDQNNKPNPKVLYLLNTPGMNVQLRRGGFSYDLYRISNVEHRMSNIEVSRSAMDDRHPDSTLITFHRIDIDLQNSNPNPVIETSVPAADYLNFYTTGTPTGGVTGVKSFGTITYKNVYPGIDLQFITGNDRLFEYNFIVRPGGDIDAIRLKVAGPEKIKHNKDGIHLKTSLGLVEETIPLCYYSLNNSQVPVKGRFRKISDQVYGFLVDQPIPAGAVLLIDPVPTRKWGTYYGGDYTTETFYTPCTTDGAGNVIVAGGTTSGYNIATAGAYLQTLQGNEDAFLVKFSPDGQRLWATYYGGSNNDWATCCIADRDDNIIFGGCTGSSNNIASPGAYQNVLRALSDGMLVKFTPGGQRLWGTYYGGHETFPQTEEITSCSVDTNRNIYFAGYTNASDFISSPGAHQPNIGGSRDDFLVKFTADGQRSWGTYYGGTNSDQDASCSTSKSGFVYLSGNTASPNNIATPGSYLPTLPGIQSSFLATFNPDGQRLWGTYYGSFSWIHGCVADTGSSVYIFGFTGDATGISTPGVFQENLNLTDNGFLTKFSSTGNRLWGTYYGAFHTEITCASIDDSGHVFVAGWVNSQNTVIASPGAYQSVFRGGATDAFLGKLTANGERLWGTYYGGTAGDWGTGCAVDKNDHVFLCGKTSSTNNTDNGSMCVRRFNANYIATPGSLQPEKSGNNNVFLVKFADCYSPDTALLINGQGQVCASTTSVTYWIDPIYAATDYHWCVSGNLTITSGQHTTSVTVDVGPVAGIDTISVYGINNCDNGFPIYKLITVLPRPVPTIIGAVNVVLGMAYYYYTDPGMTNYQWTVTGGTIVGGYANGTNVQVLWNTPGVQTISVSYTNPAGCSATGPTVVNVTVNPMPVVDFTAPDTVCVGNTVQITNQTQNGNTWKWHLCSANAAADPVGTNVGNPGGYLYNPGYITLAKQNNDCFSFVSCKGSGVIRYYHGSSFYNPPVSWTSLGTFGLLTPNEEGIQVKYDDATGNWYGWVCNENTIIRLDFGNSLWNTPVAVNIGPFPDFTTTSGLVIAKDNGSWVGFVTCTTGKLLRLNFGTSPTNTPLIWNLGTFGGNLLNPTAMSLVYEDTFWDIFILAGNNTLYRISPGSSLMGFPILGNNLGSPMGFTSPSGISMTRDCNATTGYFTNINSNELGRLTYTFTYTIIALGTNLGNVGGLVGPYSISEIVRENDSIVAWITNMSNSTLTRLVFLPCTSASVSTSSLFDPPPYFYNQTGNFNVQLVVDEGQVTQASGCKPIVVVDPITVSLGNDQSVCPGTAAILDAGPGFSGYLWSTGATTQTISALSAGTYSVTVTKWSCSATDEVHVTYLPYPQPTLGPDQTICTPQTATFDAGACNGCTYQWGNLTTGQPNVGTGQTYSTGTAGTYMVTVTGQNGCTGKDTIQLLAGIPAIVTASITAGNTTVCAGTPVSFTASGNPTGTSPFWQWKVNGVNAGTGGQVFTYTPSNGDCITCVLTSNALCVTGNPATSNQICMTVNQLHPVSLTISSTSTHTCAGVPVTFNAFPTNPGNNPVYLWKVNGVTAGTNNQVFTYTPANGDCITCLLTSDISCPTGNPAMSNSICMTVDQPLPVSVTVTTPQTTVCAGTSVTFTANPTHGGSLPGYQWKVNTVNVSSATSSTYTYVPLNGDVVTCQLTSSDNCVTGNPAMSPQVTMTVNQNFEVTVSISASSNPFCAGSQVTFTAIPDHGGLVPGYQWKVNGGNTGINSPSYTYSPSNGDQVSCILNSSASCITGNPASSNIITMTVNTNLPAGVSISTPNNPFCPGTSVTITAAPTNGGPTPIYQWKLNGANAGINLYTFTFNPAAGDSVRCIMTSNLNCVTGNPASSARIIMSERAAPNVTFTSCFDTVTILSAQPFSLHGGLPLGGQYSGPGVNTGIFTPSIAGTGLKTITYGYANVYSCLATKTKTILVLPNPAFTCGNNLTDIRDNKAYPTVQIGTQCWMASNLDFGFQISDLTPQTDNCISEKYTRNSSFVIGNSFYQWDELMRYQTSPGTQGLCPPDWHIPSAAEWNVLLNFYPGAGQAGGYLKDSLLVNGFHSYQQGFLYLNNTWAFTSGLDAGAMYWTSTASGTDRAMARGLNIFNPSVSMYPSSRQNAFGVRCMKDGL